MYLLGTKPEKKVEARISYDVINKKSDIIVDVHNMLPWLKKVCITSHVIKDDEAWFYLKFGKNCSEYQVRVSDELLPPPPPATACLTRFLAERVLDTFVYIFMWFKIICALNQFSREIVSFIFPRVPIPKHPDLRENKSSWFPEVFL